MLTVVEMATLLGTTTETVKKWGHYGLLQRHAYNNKQACLYQHPGDNPPVKSQGEKLSERRRFPAVTPIRSEEVQYEA
jgi:hypothetical protein